MGQRTAGDLMFEAYLSERGIPVPEHEPDLGIGAQPDYLVESDGQRCVAEVKSFARESWPIRRGSTSMQDVLKPIRRQIHEAARQLRDARPLKLPLVVVLTDPLRAMWGLLRPFELVAAMHGDPIVQIPTSGHAAVGAARLVAGRNGELRNDHPYVSAVAMVHELFDGTHRSETFLTHSSQAVPLPDVFFSGDRDDVYDYSDQTETYVLRQPAER